MLQLIYEDHMGIEPCKSRARNIQYFNVLCMKQYLVAMCAKSIGMHNQSSHCKSMKGQTGKVDCDIFYVKQVPYLLTVDYYSNYPEIALLSNESSR